MYLSRCWKNTRTPIAEKLMLTVSLVVTLAVILSIGIHYGMLLLTTWILSMFQGRHPATIILSLFLAVIAHLTEILVFALAWFQLHRTGLIQFSIPDPGFIDILYFSGTTYTTIGYGDIVIEGSGRIAAVVEGVMGLVLIAWTASFTYFEMNRKWLNRL